MSVSPAKVSYRASFGAHEPSAISVAVDEIYMLRSLAAHVAQNLQRDLEMATLPASVRTRHEALLPLLQKAVEGEALYGDFDPKPALTAALVDDVLSNQGWAENQGVKLDG
jgi:hypothetical protein